MESGRLGPWPSSTANKSGSPVQNRSVAFCQSLVGLFHLVTYSTVLVNRRVCWARKTERRFFLVLVVIQSWLPVQGTSCALLKCNKTARNVTEHFTQNVTNSWRAQPPGALVARGTGRRETVWVPNGFVREATALQKSLEMQLKCGGPSALEESFSRKA